MTITFLLNGESVTLERAAPTATLLDWLRDSHGLKGTKEGCNEGDCGACTVMVQDDDGMRPLNACILMLPQLHGKSVRTIEGLAAPDGALHPVQSAMITHHGSQCGFCTPGIAVSLAVAHECGDRDHDDALAGNLCRCTGYAPIVRAAQASDPAPKADWLDDSTALAAIEPRGLPNAPRTADELAALYAQQPTATLIAGATDVGLWVTKQLRNLDPVIFLNRCRELQSITESEAELRIGAGVTIEDFRHHVTPDYPSLGEMLRRFASKQVRSAATLGGNIANGSPIGDTPPPLIALGAQIHLRRGDIRRSIALEDFFVEYGKQDRAPGEFIEAISIPKQPSILRVYKLSKRFDQDISAVCGAFLISVDDGLVVKARIAFGGMAGIPKRADAVESALVGRPWTAETLDAVHDVWAQDFQPLSDLRASADYRLNTARNMLRRCLLEDQGERVSVLEVTP
ncbi:MAG: xanthine dehydrogenase small subunit [Pelagimonas sp.]|jgi:xanthine dehydrogenase small subunit|nr:xanthine dehydrogenase small subunit [Pelagimonas sp.]